MIRLTIPSIEEEDLQAVREVLLSGYLVQGEKVRDFEKAVAAFVGTKYAVAVSSGTAALHLGLLALLTQPKDLVVVTAYSFVATANVIELCGAQPVFVDIQPDTFNMDPKSLEEVLIRLMANPETAPRVKAILPVHTFGQMADMPAILRISERYGIPVVEDAACALGAKLHGRQAGTWGVMGCFSFHPRKAVTTGEGGVITSNDANLVRSLRMLRNHGQDPDAEGHDFIHPGFNYRMTEFQAALGAKQMRKADRIIASRRRLALHYNRLLAETRIQAPIVAEGSQPVYQSYVVLLPENAETQRTDWIQELKKRGIETTIGTWHIPLTTYFQKRYGYHKGEFPETDRVFFRALTLPLYESLEESRQNTVVENLLKIVNSRE